MSRLILSTLFGIQSFNCTCSFQGIVCEKETKQKKNKKQKTDNKCRLKFGTERVNALSKIAADGSLFLFITFQKKRKTRQTILMKGQALFPFVNKKRNNNNNNKKIKMSLTAVVISILRVKQ